MQIWTSTIDYQGVDRLDITVKSGEDTFAPTWAMVTDYHRGKLDWPVYTTMYTETMRLSWKYRCARWDEVLAMSSVTLCCYCKPTECCHRFLLVQMLLKAAKAAGIQAEYHGECGDELVQTARAMGGKIIMGGDDNE